MRTALISLIPMFLFGCHSFSGPVSVSAIAKEYRESIPAARLKYDGKEMSVRGVVSTSAKLPLGTGDQGSVLLREGDGSLACWFTSEQAERFSKVREGQKLTITGVFSGESGVELKFCRLVQVE